MYGLDISMEGLKKPQNVKQSCWKVFHVQSQSVKTGRDDWYFQCECSNTKLQEYENQRHVTSSKNHNNLKVTNPKDMEIWDLPDKTI